MSDKRPCYRFDEEEDEGEEMEILYEGDDDERPGLSAEERLKARDIISKLRGARGSSLANQARLTVLHNVAGSQISDEQLRQLLQGLRRLSSTLSRLAWRIRASSISSREPVV